MWSCALTKHDAPTSWGPVCRILYRLLVSLARLAVRSGRSKHGELHRWLQVNGHDDRCQHMHPTDGVSSTAARLSLDERVFVASSLGAAAASRR